MATYNTAFGSLPSPKTLTGSSGSFSTDEDEERPRNRLQQFGAEQQSQTQPPAQTQTFAQMQAAGQARPAPPPPTQPQQTAPLVQQTAQTLGVPTPAPAPAQPTMVQTLQSELQRFTSPQTAAPKPVEQPPIAMPAMQTGGGTPASVEPETPPPSRMPTQEQLDWMKANPTALNAYGEIPDGMVYVSASEGGPGLRWMTSQERQVGQTGNPYVSTEIWDNPNQAYLRFQNLPAGTRAFLEQSGNAPQKPEGYDSWLSSLGANGPVGPDPFANRPQPPFTTIGGAGGGGDMFTRLNQLMGGAGGGGTVSTKAPSEFSMSPEAKALQGRLQGILQQLESAPSPYDSEAYKAQLAASEAELESQYKTERQRLDEELARRGLSASTFGGDRMQSLAGAQARAQASMRAELLKEAANQQAQRQDVLLRAMGDLSGQMGQQEIAAYNANLERYRTSGQLEMDARRLQQDYALKGMDLTLQQARDVVDKDFKEKTLGFQLRELLSRENLTREELALRERMGLTQGRNNILSSLLGNIDLSGLTPEQLQSLLSGLGLNITLPTGGGGTVGGGPIGGGTGGGSTPGGGGGSTPITVTTPPTDLSPYSEGQQFLYNGQLLVKRNGILVDALTGRPFDTRE